MRKRLVVVVIGLVLAMAMPSVAIGGAAFTLHPAGRGQQTYASWKANVGEADPGGTGNQAIFMQKNSDQAVQAVVVIRGLAGESVSNLQPLSWDRPTSGNGSYCVNSPHWQIDVTNTDGTTASIAFGNCGGQTHNVGGGVQPNWTRDICENCISGLGLSSGATINSLAIVFDDQCCNYVLLDHISVTSSVSGVHKWDSAADNAGTTAVSIGPAIALADVVSDVLGDLLNLFPGVPATEWTLYTAVDLTPLPTAPTLP